MPVERLTFRLSDLSRIRDLAENAARSIGLSEQGVADVVIAVNEVATNAVTHGLFDTAYLSTWVDGGDLIVEIHDQGLWTPPYRPAPGPRSTSGMGLWVARLLASDISFRTESDGSRVTMRFGGKS
ncbi:ATP-binding protein [Nonomuraea sp. NPDC050310]|uniref:ATP-binding protein n=1 Tax=Nonomuraea sp. NPDC050310 TaxID=3154935 RepID=UPI00340A062A